MFKGLHLLKRYYKLAGIKTKFLAIQFVLLLLPALLSILSPAFAAEIISSLTIYDFSKAIYILSLDFIIIISSALLYFFYHLISRKINKSLYNNFNEYLYENIKRNKNIKSINLPTITNVSVCIKFNKNFLYKLCFLIKSIITLSIIFFYNYIICLIILIVSFISYLFLRITDKKIQMHTKTLAETEQKSLELFNNIHKGSEIEENYNLNIIVKNKYFNLVDTQIKTNNKISFLYNINNNFISLILKTTVFLATIYLINQIKSTTLTLSLYLILTPYLTSSAQNLISFFDLFSEFGTIENILDDFESFKFKEEKLENQKFEFSNFDFYLYNISYKDEHSNLKKINLNIEFGKSIVIYSKNKNELQALANLIERNKNISSGTILIDNKNANEIPIEQYKNIVTKTNSYPFFYNVSIIENLQMVCSNKKEIEKVIKMFSLKPLIDSLNDKENTIIDEAFDKGLLFLLGIVRCYLSKAKLICIEDIFSELSKEYLNIFMFILKQINGNRSLIIFTNKIDLNLKVNKKLMLEKGILKDFIK